MNEEHPGEVRIRKGMTSHQRATQNEDNKLTLVNGYPAPTPTITPKKVITPTPQDEGVAGLALVSTNSYDIFDSPNEGIGRCFMAKGQKISIVMKMICKEMMIYLLTTLVMKTMMNLLLIMLIKIKRMTMIRRRLSV